MKVNDLIVEEIHAIREAMSKAQGDDLQKIADAAAAVAEKTGRRLETRSPRKIPTAQKAS